MELRAGYKQTEVGVIPEDWGYALARDVLHINRGRVISHREIARNPGPFPVYSSQTKDNGVMGYISTFDFEGDHLTWTTDGANAGTVFYRTGQFNCTNVCGAGKAKVQSSTTVEFFAYYLDTVAWKHVSHVGNPKLMSGPFGSIPVVVPPPAEQRAIAAALSDTDALIASLDALIAKKRDLKQAAMQQLLTGKTRLPRFTAEWERRTLFEVCGGRKEMFDDGDWIESEHITDKGIRLIQTGNIGVGRFLEKDDRRYIFEESFLALRCKEIVQGDLLICRLAEPAGRACVLPEIGERKIVTSVDVTIARPNAQSANRTFLANLMSTLDWFRAVSDRSGGTTHKRIARGALGKISLFLPPVAEQSAIAEVLSDMDADLDALEARRDKALALKQGMVQELLTGRIRLV